MDRGYYRLVKELPDENPEEWVIGELWYLSEVKGDEVTIIQGESSWCMEADKFFNCFEFAPEGVEERQRQIVELMTNLHSIGSRQDHLLHSSNTQKLLTDDANPVETSSSTELSPVASRDPAIAAHNLKKVKTAFAYTKKSIVRRQSELQAMIKEQSLILRSKTDALTKQIAMAEEAIYIINAYLGKDEEIIQLKKGKPADIDQKIVIRQRVLYMDEECAVAEDMAKKGGIDFQNVSEFDAWIKKPSHLQQVLPEIRGIVAIKPRHGDKNYSDNPFVNAELNRQNKCLYILIRNGENLYRIYTTLWLDEVMLPRKDEFEEFFYKKRSYFDENKEPIPLQPGSKDYLEAMEKAEAEKRRFYTVLILIQGLLDRTKVFHPLPEEQINICNLAIAQKYITLLYDSENLLGQNRPSFDNWLDEVNGKLEVGCRIVGDFNNYYLHQYFGGNNDRKRPKGTLNPDDNTLYVIEKKDGDNFFFYYSREGETIYSGWGDYRGHQAVRRASYLVHKSDGFVINIDAVTVEEIEYYLRSRINRHKYLQLVPLLKAALIVKKQESTEEEPFRKLLIGEIAKKYGASFAEAEAHVDVLMNWWKFKTREHRALTSDDAKALRMIVGEFGRRKNLNGEIEENDAIVKQLRDDTTLAIFYRKNKEYTVYRWLNNENIFVQEELWTKRDRLECVSTKPWQTVDKRHQSWRLLWRHERWATWGIGARSQEHLTDPECEAATDYAVGQLTEDLLGWRGKEKKKEGYKSWLKPLAVVVTNNEAVYLYYLQYHAIIPKKRLLTHHLQETEYGMIKIVWEKKSGIVNFKTGDTHAVCFHVDNPPWSQKYKGSLDIGRKFRRVIRLFPNNIDAAKNESEKVDLAKKKIQRLKRPIYKVQRFVFEKLVKIWYEEQRKKFVEEYVDEDGELWEYHKEDLTKPSLWPHWLEHVLDYLIENNINFDGLTIENMVTQANKLGLEWQKDCPEYEPIKDLVIQLPQIDNTDEDDYL
jgi:hypothetical protein